jgi:hypothetical protein
MTTKEKLNRLNELGFSNGFISKNTDISAARIYNAGGDRKVSLTDVEHERINQFYELGVQLSQVKG